MRARIDTGAGVLSVFSDNGEWRDDHIKHGGEHKNEIGVVLGITYETDESEGYATFGLEYERMFGQRFGITAVAEYIPEIEAFIVIAPLVYRPDGPLRLVTGPGVEIEPRTADRGTETREESANGRESRFLWRFGVGYSFKIGDGLVATPAFDVDLVRDGSSWDTALVLDVAIGFAF